MSDYGPGARRGQPVLFIEAHSRFSSVLDLLARVHAYLLVRLVATGRPQTHAATGHLRLLDPQPFVSSEVLPASVCLACTVATLLAALGPSLTPLTLFN